MRQYRVGLLGLPRKNGKSALGSGIALFGLFDEPGAEVYSCAGDKEQARIVFAEAKRAVEAEPELAGVLKLYRDAIEYPAANAVYRVLSAEAYTKEGLNPSLVVFDEVHVQPNDELWNTMRLGMGTRRQPLLLGITTAGVRTDATGQDSLCYRLYQYGSRVASGEVEDPTFFLTWYGAPDGADHEDRKVWRAANPALGDYLREEALASDIKTTPEAEFRTKHLNQWVSSAIAWLPAGAFEARGDGRRIEPGSKIVLGFDGSYSGDSTALVGSTLDGHLEVLGAWERPVDDMHWRVPIEEVVTRIRECFRDYTVIELACDPYRWAREIQTLGAEGWPVVEFNTAAPARMVPACAKFYDAVADGKLTHSGDPRLVRHVRNAVLKVDSRGPRIVKEHRGSPRKIDLAVAAVVAYDRATFHAAAPTSPAIFIPFD